MKRFPIKPRHILIAIGLIVVVALVVNFNQRMMELNNLSGQLELVRAEGTAVMQTQVALMTQVAYAGSDAAVERWAYVDGGWIRLDDHPVVLIPIGTPLATPIQQTGTPIPSPENWQVWWNLFFGKQK